MDKTTKELFEKYDIPTPRYTSYPIHPKWKKNIDQQLWFKDLQSSINNNNEIDVYLHLPFCEKLCYYCGCNRVINKDHSIEKDYINALIKEWELYKKHLNNFKIRAIHLGGGTPTYFSAKNLDKLLDHFSDKIIEHKFYGSVEMDPRTATLEQIKVLKKYHFTKASLGIQDFNQRVQKAINRIQPIYLVENLLEKLRNHEFSSLNFDLIYGLPYQERKTIKETLESVKRLSPDTISLFSYAHLPSKIKNQKVIDGLPMLNGLNKRLLFETSKETLINFGYKEIGLDHFALDHDILYKSYQNKTMKRSFMGYVPYISNVTIALGSSSISNSVNAFIQNEKNVSKYIMAIQSEKIPIISGHFKTPSENIMASKIQDIMCYGTTETQGLDTSNLNEFLEDRLVEIDKQNLIVTHNGRPFLRNICMGLDPNNHTKKNLSRP